MRCCSPKGAKDLEISLAFRQIIVAMMKERGLGLSVLRREREMKQFKVCLATIALMLVCSAAAPALASISVSSYQTAALTNAYAPLDQSAYFDKQTLASVS